MTNRRDDMRTLLDSISLAEEHLNELLGMKTAKKAVTRAFKGKGAPEKQEKIEKTHKDLSATYKKFVQGETRIPEYRGKKSDPSDPQVLADFLNVIGFSDDDIKQIMDETNNNESDALYELLGGLPSSVNKILKKAAETSVVYNVPLGQGAGKRTSTRTTTTSQGAEKQQKPPTENADPGLNQLGSGVASLAKRISPAIAEKLDVGLYDGFDLKASDLKSEIEKNPDSVISQLALVGYAHIANSIKKSTKRKEQEPEGEPETGETSRSGVNIS